MQVEKQKQRVVFLPKEQVDDESDEEEIIYVPKPKQKRKKKVKRTRVVYVSDESSDEGSDEDLEYNDDPENTFRILIFTDTHLGHNCEKPCELGQDAFDTFEE